MGPKRRSSDTDDQIIKQGCLTKSPPSYVFNKKTSWKGRLLKLCKTNLGTYVLHYYAYDGVTEDWKGDIYLSDVKSVELGTDAMEKIPAITRLFNNKPSNILCIKTEGRNYYLVDESEENIAEWQKCITDAWTRTHQKPIIERPTNPSANLLRLVEDQEEAMRPKSYPEDYPRTDTAIVEDLNRQRSHTDPESRKGTVLTINDYKELKLDIFIEEKDIPITRKHSNTLAVCSQIGSVKARPSEEGRRHSATASLQGETEGNRSSDDLTDPAYDSDPDDIYDTPRSVLMKMSGSQDSSVEPEKDSDIDSAEEGGEHEVYEKMGPISQDEITELPPTPPRRSLVPTINRYSNTQGSQLKKAHILRMLYEKQSESDVESITLTVPTDHLQRYLGIQEAGERLWVSKWKGPVEIGCLFYHGDHIESINGFRPGSKEFFSQMLIKSVSNEVHLVLTRNKNAPIFHLDGCSCERS